MEAHCSLGFIFSLTGIFLKPQQPQSHQVGRGVSYFPGGNVYGGSLYFRVYFFSYWYFRASFSKDDK